MGVTAKSGTLQTTRAKPGTSKAAAAARRLSFAHAYIANGRNGTQAAITAGFSQKGAHVTAARLLEDIRVSALIAELTAELSQATRLTAERVLTEVGRLAFSDIRKLYREDGSMKPPTEWDADTAATVATFEVQTSANGVTTRKVKMWDKVSALEKAMRHLGLFERDSTQRAENLSIQIALVEKSVDEKLDRLIARTTEGEHGAAS